MATVVVGLSGGVDSAVTALLLKQQGYDVVGMFMVNWEETDSHGVCTSESDFEDVKRVADTIGIPYYTVNYAKEYWDRVFEYFLKSYKEGRTPNPDVLCNREIKFGPFLNQAMQLGADYIATGHYAKKVVRDGVSYLYKASDLNKDQTYFLNQLSQYQLSKVIFPLAEIQKPKVRQIAEEHNLVNARKKDSTGICFIGERNFRKFLKEYIPMQKGIIKDMEGNILGEHDGVMYYTIGQRRGLNLGGKDGYDNDRWFVVDKDVKNNVLYVNCGECDEMFSSSLIASSFNWISGKPADEFDCFVKCRYRQPDQAAHVSVQSNGDVLITFKERQKAITLGQFAVLYAEDGMCYGGGEIIKCNK